MHEDDWRLHAVRQQAQVRTIDESNVTLGVVTGDLPRIEQHLSEKTMVVQAIQSKVELCQDSQTEHVLSRQSLGVARVNHILRVHGDVMKGQGGELQKFDDLTCQAMARLFPGLTPESRAQATLAPPLGGLGWRRATDVARPANLGALVAVGPLVRSMAEAATHAGLLPPGAVEQVLEADAQAVAASFLEELDEIERVKAEDYLRKAHEAATQAWQARLRPANQQIAAPVPDLSYDGLSSLEGRDPGDSSGAGGSDAEERSRQPSAPRLQKDLAALQDLSRLRHLEEALRRQCNWEQVQRLQELRHPEVSHQWLWHLDSRSGSVLSDADYVACVLKRLGARALEGEKLCRVCGSQLDPVLEHSETCALGEATRGHYACVRAVVDGLRLADSNVSTEPQGLTSTMERPADIFTTAAVPGRSAALDLCIASTNAASARGDAAEAAFRRKLRHYRDAIPELAEAGIAFRPLVWTADGRPHPAATRTLCYAAGQAAQRGGEGGSAQLLRRWKYEVQINIMRRRAAMSRAVLPEMSARDAWLLRGHTEGSPTEGRRACLLEEEAAFDGIDEDPEALIVDFEA